ncbi:MAG: thioesterase, partial [Myxococcaceae bacterium]|nr:thioesterase [Myxococcaceae bacterium]
LEQLNRYAETFNASATLKHFGVKVSFPDPDTVECVIDEIKPEQRGGLGTDAINGGVLSAMFDLAIGCTPALVDPTRRSATVHLSINFMRAVRGEKLIARSKVDRAGDVLLFASAQIFDDKGVVCATCTGMSRLSELTWAGGESPAIN